MALKFLLNKNTEGMDKKHWFWYWAYRFFFVFAAAVGLTVAVLLLSFPIGKIAIFIHFFRRPLVFLLNFLPILASMFLCYFLYGRAWPAFLTTAFPVSVIAIGNFYKIKFRGDVFVFSDVKDIFLGLSIAVEENYDTSLHIRVIIYFLCIIFGIAFLLFLLPGKMNFLKRIKFSPAPLALLVAAVLLCTNTSIYKSSAVTNGYFWATADYHSEHGAVYSFLNSINDAVNKAPKGYDEDKMEKLLASYKNDNIPKNEKVNVIFIMREANNDISTLTDADGIDWSCYDYYNELKQESYSGRLFTNYFAGGTVNSERCAITGAYKLKDYRAATNSYVRYFKAQGYSVSGSHPSNDWYYNRKNINSALGFDEYYFIENYYKHISEDPAKITDKLLYADLIKQFEARDKTKPYFSFNVTYEGHGPYDTTTILNGKSRVEGNYTDYTKNVISNYLNGIESTNAALKELVDYFRGIDEPVVLCVYGDHNPWMGDNNTVAAELGINFDFGTEEGLRNYYETEYLIWANDSAKETLDEDFQGVNDATISPCYLMNVLFREAGWKGPSYMKFMNDYMEQMPIVSTNAVYYVDGVFTTTLTEKQNKKLSKLDYMTYYWNNNLLYKEEKTK